VGKRKRNRSETPVAEAAPFEPFGAAATALWCAAAAALAVVPDQKILRYKLLALETAVGLQILLLAAAWLRSGDLRWRRSPLDWPVALYAIGGLLFFAISPERGASQLELVRILFSAAVFFAASRARPGPAFPAVWTAAASLVGLYALLQTRGGLGPLMVPQLERPIATFGNPIFLAGYLAASFVLAAGHARAAAGRERALYAAGALLCLLGLWTTQTRAALVGIGAAAALAGAFALPPKRRWPALGALAVATLAFAWWFRERQWTHGLIWKDTLSLWKAHPLFGCGLGRFHIEFVDYASPALRALWPEQKVIVNFAHNEYLQVLAETGLVGLGLLLAIPASAAAWLWRVWRTAPDPRRGAYLFAAFTLLAQNLFSPDIRFGVSSFVVFAFLGAATAEDEPRPFPAFPGRLAAALMAALFVAAWGRLAAQPLLAQRRLAAAPDFHVGKSDEANRMLADMERRLEADPDNADLAENLAFAYAKRKDWRLSIERFERVTRLRPDRPGPFNNLGNIHYSIGNREGAIEWWKKSLAIDDAQIDARLNLAKTLYETGRLKESGMYVQQVLERDPGNEKAQILLKKMIE
jgi:O-antigen ligase